MVPADTKASITKRARNISAKIIPPETTAKHAATYESGLRATPCQLGRTDSDLEQTQFVFIIRAKERQRLWNHTQAILARHSRVREIKHQ